MPIESFRKLLLNDLKNPQQAIAYMEAAFVDDDPTVFLSALKDVIEANGGIEGVLWKWKTGRPYETTAK